MTIFRISDQNIARSAGQYIVQRGDSFSTIATREYHNVRMWPVIWAYNPRENPHVLREGETIILPKITQPPGVPRELVFLAERIWNRF